MARPPDPKNRSFGTFRDIRCKEPTIMDSSALSKSTKPKICDVLPQIVASCISLSAVPQVGLNMAFSGVLIPQLATDPNIRGFDKDSASWIASLVTISQPIGALFVGPLMDKIGRRKTCIVTNLPILVGWCFIYFAKTELWPIYVARVLCGFGAGMTTVGLVYTAEVSHSSYRSMLLSLNSVNIAFGILLTTVLGVYLEWHTCALLFGALSALTLVLSFIIPESPHWLVNFTSTPREEVAKHVRWLNRPQWSFDEEWQRLEESKTKERTNEEEEEYRSKTKVQKLADKATVFFEQTSIKPLTILLIIFFFQQTCGIYVVIFYTVNIFRSLGGEFGLGFDEYSATSSLGVLKFCMSIVSAILSKFVGRRPIMMVSCIGMGLACVATAVCLHLNGISTVDFGDNTDGTPLNITGYQADTLVEHEPSRSLIMKMASSPSQVIASSWILIFILLFVAAGSAGQMVIPWTLLGELLPTKIRASGSGLISSYSSLLLFVVIKTFPGLSDYTTLPVLFFAYAVMSFISAVYVYFFLPETFRKNFVEIAHMFDGTNKNSLAIND